ncbi:MAG: hypothetical protein JO100_04225 [Pseudonocardia sp.]|nr:hypothetical protein [Pseudonocardia sp.]
MATTWTELVSYVRVRYEVFGQTDQTVDFDLPTTAGRTQRVSMHHIVDDGEWIRIESPIAKVDGTDLRRLLELAGQLLIGGVVVANGLALFRHTTALSELSPTGFDRPLRLVAAGADNLDLQLAGP